MSKPLLCIFTLLYWSTGVTCARGAEVNFGSIGDPAVRNVTKQFHLHCPSTRLCTVDIPFNNHLQDNDYDLSCCPPSCQCGPQCDITRSCCPDIMESLLTPNEVDMVLASPYRTVCAQHRHTGQISANNNCYKMVAVCPETYRDFKIRNACNTDYSKLDFTSHSFAEFLPVTENTDGALKTYRNKDCAICSGAMETDLLSWRVEVECYGMEIHVDTIEAIPNIISKHPACNVVFKEPLAFQYRIPKALIDRCNVTGLWERYDPLSEAACLSYTARYGPFKNIHCYLCNGYRDRNTTGTCIVTSMAFDSEIGHTLMDLIDFNNHETEADHGQDIDGNCTRSQVYDTLQKTCVNLECSPMLLWNEALEACVPMNDTGSRQTFQMSFALVPRDKAVTDLTNFTFIGNAVRNKVGDFLTNRFADDYYVALCSVKSFLKVNITFSEFQPHNVSLHSRALTYIGTQLTLVVEDILDLGQFIEGILTLYSSRTTFPTMNIVNYDISPEIFGNVDEFMLEDPNDGLTILPLPDIENDPFLCNDTALYLSPLHLCPKVKLTRLHFIVDLDKHTLIIPERDLKIDLSQVILHPCEKEVSLCKNVYTQYFMKTQENVTSDPVQFILSTICLCLSLICLVLTQIVYCAFKKLRTLPGLNNMALVTCLFVAQLTFLISKLVEINIPWLCQTFGVLIHASLLSSFFWMNVCTFHMARVFLTVQNKSHLVNQEYLCTFKAYALFVIVMSALFVGINLLFSLVGSDTAEIGYGGHNCYITTKEMIGYTVAIPLGFVIVTDFIMFVVVICRVVRTPGMRKHTKSERNNVVIFVKLSTVTGLTWIFAFIYQWSHVTAFSYLFIVLNASQGVFIMFSFVFNKRVLQLVREKTLTSSGNTLSSKLHTRRRKAL